MAAFGAQGIFSAGDIVAQNKRLAALETAVFGRHGSLVQLVVFHVIYHSALYQHRCVVYDRAPVAVGSMGYGFNIGLDFFGGVYGF